MIHTIDKPIAIEEIPTDKKNELEVIYKLRMEYSYMLWRQNLFLYSKGLHCNFLYSKWLHYNIQVSLDHLILFFESSLKYKVLSSNVEFEYKKTHCIESLLALVKIDSNYLEENKDLIDSIINISKMRNKIRYGEVEPLLDKDEMIIYIQNLLDRYLIFFNNISTNSCNNNINSIKKIKPLEFRELSENKFEELATAYYVSFMFEFSLHWNNDLGGSFQLYDLLFAIELWLKLKISKTSNPPKTHDILKLIEIALSTQEREFFEANHVDSYRRLKIIAPFHTKLRYHETCTIYTSLQEKHSLKEHIEPFIEFITKDVRAPYKNFKHIIEDFASEYPKRTPIPMSNKDLLRKSKQIKK